MEWDQQNKLRRGNSLVFASVLSTCLKRILSLPLCLCSALRRDISILHAIHTLKSVSNFSKCSPLPSKKVLTFDPQQSPSYTLSAPQAASHTPSNSDYSYNYKSDSTSCPPPHFPRFAHVRSRVFALARLRFLPFCRGAVCVLGLRRGGISFA
jgi:hypothetical protein